MKRSGTNSMSIESVAESAQRPLYRVTTGELSTDVEKLEKQLSDAFRLGARWKAVVLLDEADVLMSRRTVEDLRHSSIVAGWLYPVPRFAPNDTARSDATSAPARPTFWSASRITSSSTFSATTIALLGSVCAIMKISYIRPQSM